MIKSEVKVAKLNVLNHLLKKFSLKACRIIEKRVMMLRWLNNLGMGRLMIGLSVTYIQNILRQVIYQCC